ncbi:MAG TPA: hypothetical protein EYP69_02110, partial [Bacteroidales bacterium]|nr:hypothetical protein [Bacteroidales bacterium]
MNNRSLYSYFLLSAALILLAITGGYFVNHTSEHIPTDKIRKNFQEAQQQMEKIMLETASFVKKNTNETNNIRYFSRLDKKYSDKLMFFYRFKAGKLQNWSTNELNISSDLLKISNQSVIEYDRNIIQIFKQKISDNFLLGVLVLRRDYYIYNKYLQSYNNLDIPQNIKITLTTEPSEYVIKNISGNPAFSLTSTKKTLRQNTTAENFFFFVFLAGFALLLFSVLRLKNKLLIATVFIVLWVLRLVLLYGKFPDSLYHISLFQPFAYSFNSWMFSLGDA